MLMLLDYTTIIDTTTHELDATNDILQWNTFIGKLNLQVFDLTTQSNP